ncbi:hypothetical protein QFC22_005474 [Naganishia vaughanmartiniae]|uniref:Uncharacterized protein n=1 Tax=Naganishia vaughanmartiniae TaxID=1424756 RepID=A0ACC2WVI0_9TREE|nr:hypothetical protein QFC22_005474 [Naganishia vaughanmartiniae]
MAAKPQRSREDDEIDIKPRWSEEARPIDFSPAPVVRSTFPVKATMRDTPPPLQVKGKSPALGTADQQAKLESILAAVKEELPSDMESESSKTRDGSARVHQVPKAERQKDRSPKKPRLTSEELKDQHLKTLIQQLVIRNMSKYKQEISGRDTFKKHAREVCQSVRPIKRIISCSSRVILNDQCADLLFQKEQRHHSYSSSSYESLTEEKQKQMKDFIKMFSAKVVKGLIERRTSGRPSHRVTKLRKTHSEPSSSFCTPTEGSSLLIVASAENTNILEERKPSPSENESNQRGSEAVAAIFRSGGSDPLL